jgi:hypothetical protein
MPQKKLPPSEELLTKLLAVNMWIAGASQGKIATTIGRGTTWVNDLLKGVPKPPSK